jgi:Ca2+-binding RTX toxin-like protein
MRARSNGRQPAPPGMASRMGGASRIATLCASVHACYGRFEGMRGSTTNSRSRRVIATAAVAIICLTWFLARNAAMAPAGTFADVSFANGVLTIVGDVGGAPVNDKHALRCKDGFVLVGLSQRPPDPVHCGQVREVVARPLGGNDSVDMSGVTREFGGGGPIEIKIFGADGSDRLTGAPQQHNLLYGGGSSDNIDGGDIADRIVGGPDGDILSGGGGNDFVSGGAASDLMYGDSGNDSLFGGPGNDALNGGPGRDKLVGGPGRDREAQGYSSGR